MYQFLMHPFPTTKLYLEIPILILNKSNTSKAYVIIILKLTVQTDLPRP